MDLNFIEADNLRAAGHYLLQLALQQGLNCMAAVLILIAGWWLSGRAAAAVTRTFAHTRIDTTMRPMLTNLVQWFVRGLTVVLVLAQFGVQTASIVAVLGAAGLAIGLALQGTLQNIAAGIMLVLLRPFRVGQYIDAQGVAGTVRETGLFMTELTTADGVCLRVPNGKLWGSAITNYSENPSRRMDIEVTVARGNHAGPGMAALREMLASEPRVLAEPRAEVMATSFTAQGVTINVRYWTTSEDFWPVRFAFYERIEGVLQEAGCVIAVPVQELRLPADEGAASALSVSQTRASRLPASAVR